MRGQEKEEGRLGSSGNQDAESLSEGNLLGQRQAVALTRTALYFHNM